jgi:hypothetical protein
MRRLVLMLILATAMAAALTSPAGATIIPGRSIAGVELGDSRATVRSILGDPLSIRRGRNDFGRWTDFRYFKLVITFQGNRGATALRTTRGFERTPRGVGVGAPRANVIAEEGARCEGRICTVGTLAAGERVTAFFLRSGRVSSIIVGIVID